MIIPIVTYVGYCVTLADDCHSRGHSYIYISTGSPNIDAHHYIVYNFIGYPPFSTLPIMTGVMLISNILKNVTEIIVSPQSVSFVDGDQPNIDLFVPSL